MPDETVAYMAKIVPQIDGDAAVADRTVDRPARSEWSVTPLFIARVTAVTADDLLSGRPPRAGTIIDLSALVPPSDGLFVRWSQEQEGRP